MQAWALSDNKIWFERKDNNGKIGPSTKSEVVSKRSLTRHDIGVETILHKQAACGACDKYHAMTLTHTTRTPVPQVCWWKTSVIVPSTKMLSYNVSTQSLLCRIAHAVQWRRFAMHTLTGSEVRPFRTLRQRLFKLWLSILGLLSLAVLIPTIFSSHALIRPRSKKVCGDHL